MIRKSAQEIATGLRKGELGADEVYNWLSTATAIELRDFIRWLGIFEPTWVAFARDALNVVLANENTELQKDIRDLTKKLHRLTIVLAFIGLITIYPIINSFFNLAKPESNVNQLTDTNQIHNKNNDSLKKTEAINHKKTP